MATAPAVGRPGFAWHTRATWSARDDRLVFAAWLGLLWAGILAGFGVDFSRFLHEAPPAPRVVAAHAFVFTGWMLLLTVQVLFIVGNRVAWHRKLGWLTAAWACLMGVLGPWAAVASQSQDLHGPQYEPPFLAVQFGNIPVFLFLVAWGIALRKNTAAHKRIMILSTIALVDAGFARFSGWLWPAEPRSAVVWYFWTFYGNVLLLALMLASDWRRGRIMKQFVLGAVTIVSLEMIETLLYFSPSWRELTASWVQAWARHG